MELKDKKEGQLRKDRVILIIALLITIILAVIYLVISQGGQYDKYNQYNEENKKIGNVEHYEKDDENLYISLYYPKTDDKNLNKIIKTYYKNFIKEQKADKKSKDILYMDYSIDEIYKQFVNLKFDVKRYNEDDKEILSKQEIFTYDKKKEKILTIDDCLRNNFKTVLTGNDAIQNLDVTSNDIRVEKDNLVIYTNKDLKEKISINYKDNQSLIKLANKNIPSDAPLDVAAPAPQPKIDPNKKMIAITLDDGPHKTNTLKVIEEFEKYNGRATFLMQGKNVKLYPDVVKTVYEHGFEIGSHSWDHPDLRKLDSDGVNKQIVDTQNEVFKVTGFEPKIIRPPYGATNDTAKAVIYNNGMKIALWSLDTEDWKLKDANKIKDVILDKVFDGAVILVHDIHSFTVEGLEMALKELDSRGYQFVTLDTLSQYHQLKNVIR